MKQLQNDFTTPEQSKRLLELGVPADSADCYYTPIDSYRHPVVFYTDSPKLWECDRFPCWSAGRLIEIFLVCTSVQYDMFYPLESPLGKKFPSMEGYRNLLREGRVIDAIIEELEELKKNGMLDFSKLED